jgi:para-nitrobenzyl esterase
VQPEVETSRGRVAGSEVSGIRTFQGIPFGAPCDGRRRFQPPEPPEAWTHLLDATSPGPAAPQFSLPFFGFVNASGASRMSEDCLRLNVWTPALDGARRPVLFWIHGGGFMVGSGATPLYNGSHLARRGDVVVVSINYRLGALGYAHLGLADLPGFERCTNLGVRDQILALEWVQENIERFGGDPGQVCVFGQSAGGMSVGALLGAPRARPLFQRAICMSGAADHVIQPELGREVAMQLLEDLGNPAPTPDALASLAVADFLKAQRETIRRIASLRTMMMWLPVVDNDVIEQQPLAAVRSGATRDIPLLVGTTLDEWKLFRAIDGGFAMGEEELLSRFERALSHFPEAPEAPVAIEEYRDALLSRGARTTPSDVWCSFQGARMMQVPATRLLEGQSDGGGAAYGYLFTWRPPVGRNLLGAFHALDIPFVFGSFEHPLARALTGIAPSVGRLSRKMQRSWLRFAREGRPGDHRLPTWLAATPPDRPTMTLGRRCALDRAPLEQERWLLERWSGEAA